MTTNNPQAKQTAWLLDAVLTVDEVAQEYSVSRYRVLRAVDKGILVSRHTSGGFLLITRVSVSLWLKEGLDNG
ncbi:helix-turn-helix domain-containing protein [bacterium]|nr:helix-turn-helix domain-containing protein [bacterium]